VEKFGFFTLALCSGKEKENFRGAKRKKRQNIVPRGWKIEFPGRGVSERTPENRKASGSGVV